MGRGRNKKYLAFFSTQVMAQALKLSQEAPWHPGNEHEYME